MTADSKDTPILEVSHLCRSFGSLRAVNDISFKIYPGQSVGLIGSNGAGKTTTMKMLVTLDIPDSGEILIQGRSAVDYPELVRPALGWMPDDFRPYKNTTIRDYLDFFSRAYGLKGGDILRRVDEVLDFTELAPLQQRLIDKLSKGQNQRLSLARTLISDPDILILDEPAAGLDPKARVEFKNLVSLLKERGKTLLISSHILSELGEMCDSLIFMNEGKIVHDGDKNDLLQNRGATGWPFEIKTAGPREELELWLAARPGWTFSRLTESGALAEFESNDPGRVAAELRQISAALPVCDFHRTEQKLEDAFVDILRNNHPSVSPVSHE